MSVVKNKNGRGILLAMVHAIQQNKQLLGDVDGLIGDGDHGMNMNKGFTLYEEQLGDQDTSLSDGLFDLGSVLLNKIGGSMGPIYGTIFMEMSLSLIHICKISPHRRPVLPRTYHSACRRRGPRQKSSDRAGRQDVEAGPWNRKGV